MTQYGIICSYVLATDLSLTCLNPIDHFLIFILIFRFWYHHLRAHNGFCVCVHSVTLSSVQKHNTRTRGQILVSSLCICLCCVCFFTVHKIHFKKTYLTKTPCWASRPFDRLPPLTARDRLKCFIMTFGERKHFSSLALSFKQRHTRYVRVSVSVVSFRHFVRWGLCYLLSTDLTPAKITTLTWTVKRHWGRKTEWEDDDDDGDKYHRRKLLSNVNKRRKKNKEDDLCTWEH